MRTLTLHVKADFVRQDETTRTCSPDKQIADKQFADCEKRYDLTPSKIETDSTISDQRSSRPRSRTFTFTKGDVSPGKRLRSAIRPQSINGNVPKRDASRSPEKRSGSSSSAPKNNPIEFVRYLKSAIDPTKAEVGRIHKLRLILRNETVAWVDDFIRLGGMTETIEFLRRIMQMQWREEHEDQLLHETLRCLRGLCMTTVALAEFDRFADQLLPELMAMLFDVGKKGPSEYNTRVIVFNLMRECGPQRSTWRTLLILSQSRTLLQASKSAPMLQTVVRSKLCVTCKGRFLRQTCSICHLSRICGPDDHINYGVRRPRMWSKKSFGFFYTTTTLCHQRRPARKTVLWPRTFRRTSSDISRGLEHLCLPHLT